MADFCGKPTMIVCRSGCPCGLGQDSRCPRPAASGRGRIPVRRVRPRALFRWCRSSSGPPSDGLVSQRLSSSATRTRSRWRSWCLATRGRRGTVAASGAVKIAPATGSSGDGSLTAPAGHRRWRTAQRFARSAGTWAGVGDVERSGRREAHQRSRGHGNVHGGPALLQRVGVEPAGGNSGRSTDAGRARRVPLSGAGPGDGRLSPPRRRRRSGVEQDARSSRSARSRSG
jgi:hypothetical protein